eukprot:87870_1
MPRPQLKQTHSSQEYYSTKTETFIKSNVSTKYYRNIEYNISNQTIDKPQYIQSHSLTPTISSNKSLQNPTYKPSHKVTHKPKDSSFEILQKQFNEAKARNRLKYGSFNEYDAQIRARKFMEIHEKHIEEKRQIANRNNDNKQHNIGANTLKYKTFAKMYYKQEKKEQLMRKKETKQYITVHKFRSMLKTWMKSKKMYAKRGAKVYEIIYKNICVSELMDMLSGNITLLHNYLIELGMTKWFDRREFIIWINHIRKIYKFEKNVCYFKDLTMK